MSIMIPLKNKNDLWLFLFVNYFISNLYLDLLATFDWICVYLLEKTAKRIEELQSTGMSTFDVRNDSQAFYAINLAIVYGQVR